MSELIPNLSDLRAQLPAAEIAADAHEFVAGLATAGSLAEVTSMVDALVDRWLVQPDDDRG